MPLLEVQNLFNQHILKDISFKVEEGKTLGIVGESGSGKTTLALAILRLIPILKGKILFQNQDISNLSDKELRPFRKDMQMIFQDPYGSLNPRMNLMKILEEPFILQKISSKERKEKVKELLPLFGLTPDSLSKYPHEFSGGQKQRISIARAFALSPKLVIADEPVSALDVSIQAQILNLIRKLQDTFQTSYLFISHDISVIRYVSHHILVLYQGRVMEYVSREKFFEDAQHPYSHLLLESLPGKNRKAKTLTESIETSATGCVFAVRCPYKQDKCLEVIPEYRSLPNDPEHLIACHYPQRAEDSSPITL
jgi:oligopeptide/dipeptide ABC transporter ATP-binding protein